MQGKIHVILIFIDAYKKLLLELIVVTLCWEGMIGGEGGKKTGVEWQGNSKNECFIDY